MKDENKTKKQLVNELEKMRKMIAKLEASISNQNISDKALKESEEKYRSLVESSEDSIYLVDSDLRYIFMNRKHLSRLGLSNDQYHGLSYSGVHSYEETKKFAEKVEEVFRTGMPLQYEYKSQRDNRYFLRTLSPVKEPDGKTKAVTVVSKNISELKRMEEELRSMSVTDELTGLYNRRGFFTLVEQQLKMANRLKKGILMLYADLDYLKGLNDTWGHREGDKALIEIANLLKENYRESDIIARIGGDEFVVIPVGTAEDSIEIIIERLERNLKIYNSNRESKYELSLSVGVTLYNPECPCSIDELLVQADEMMYKQKRDKQKFRTDRNA